MTAWKDTSRIDPQSWRCGFCGRDVASDRGWYATEHNMAGYGRMQAFVAICPRCDIPSIITGDGRTTVPPSAFGEGVAHLPADVATLYGEARNAVTSGAPNCAALACRKILMHVAVEKGATEGKKFVVYVDHLSSGGYVPPDAREWIDEIRHHGNDAAHEIDLITDDEARDMVEFTAMLLRMVYEYPERGRQAKAAREARRP
jgi:hypothetical protein